MIPRLRNSIALKITLLVLGGTSLVLIAVLIYGYVFSRKIILSEAEQRGTNLALSVARRIEQEFRAIEKVPRNLAGFLETGQWDRHTLVRLIERLLRDNPEIFGSTVAFAPNALEEGLKAYAPYYYRSKQGPKFEQLATESYNYFIKDWYHVPEVLAAPVWAEPYYDEGGGHAIMTTYSFPVFRRGNGGTPKNLKAIITADVSLEWLTNLVSSLQVGRTGFGFIVSETGTFVTNPLTDLIMRQSMFSLADDYRDPTLRQIGRAMTRDASGFVELVWPLTGEDVFLAYARVPSPGWAFAAVLPKKELFAELSALHSKVAVGAVAGVTILLLMSILVARSLAWPLGRMAEATVKVASGDLDVDLSSIRRSDEVGMLADAFTRMVNGLKERDRIRDTFGRYLTREVVNRLLEAKDGLQLGGESREITMIMSDLRGFTSLASTMPPEEVIALLNRYFEKMFEILIDHHGIIDEIIGDAVLAFFGAPEPIEDHAGLAVACAVRMQAAMDDINDLNEAQGWPRVEMGVAVNTGRVVVGNIGSEKRAKYGAVGSEVNFTGRIESCTVGGQVLISRSTYERLSDIIEIRNIVQVEMKGIAGKVDLYDVMGIQDKYHAYLPEREDKPVPLQAVIEAQVYPIDQKILTGTASAARITHASLTSAIMILSKKLEQWQDIRIVLETAEGGRLAGVVYAKVVSFAGVGDEFEATVRFTSVSPEAYRVFRHESGLTLSPRTMRISGESE